MDNLTKEKNEAIIAGRRAIRSLYDMKLELDRARSWGLWDIIGGGGFTTFIKHTKINKASMLCSQAKRDIEDFEKELRDVLFINNDLDISISPLLTIFDFSSSDFLADMLVQRKINQARESTDNAIRTIERIISQLEKE